MTNPKMLIKTWRRRLVAWFAAIPSEEFSRDFTVRALVLTGLVILIVIWIFSILSFPPSDYLVPLKYNSFMGVTALGAWYQLYAVPLILLFIYILNTILAHTAYKKDKMVAYILLGTSIFAIVCGGAVVFNLWRVISA